MTVAELLHKHGIVLDNTAPGRYYTTCPRCSKDRKKPGHKDAKCLGVTIDGDAVHWGCNHCHWKGSGVQRRDDLTTYVYRDSTAVVRFRKVRNLPGREPRFWLEQPDSKGGWKKGTKGVDTSIIYRADEVAKAGEAGRTICVSEGERDVDNLWRLDLPAACNAHGASEPGKNPKWTAAHSAQLKGADIIILNDNDDPGYAHADAVSRLSHGVAKRVRRLDLKNNWPEIPKGGDVSDYLAAGHSAAQLAALIAAAPDYAPGDKSEAAAGEPASGQAASDDDAELEKLARMSRLDFERARAEAAKRFGVRVAIIDRLTAAKRAELRLNADDGHQGRALTFPEPEIWHEPVDGAPLLDAIAKAIRNHVVLSEVARDAAALWVLHTHLINCFFISPRLGVCSPVKGCAKSLLLDVLTHLVWRPQLTANVTPAAVFRVIEAYQPTLLIDEADTFIYDNDGLRGVLNGNRKGSQVLRTVGDQHEVRAFATYSACAVALIGKLPDTLHDRAIGIDLKRRLRSEKIEPYRPDRAGHLDVLARKAGRWARDNAEAMADADPKMPDGIINREADNWRPLLAIADAARGDWPARASAAAKAAHVAAADDDASLIEALLVDIRTISEGKEKMPSADLVEALVAIEGRPWAEMGKNRKPLTQNGLARMLKPLKITTENIRVGGKTPKGYVFKHCEEAFARYLPAEGVFEPPQRHNTDETGTSEPFQTATSEDDVAVRKCEKSANDGPCGGVAVENGCMDAKGMSERAIDALATWYEQTFYERRDEPEIETRLGFELRRRLRDDHGVLKEFIKVEAERVMVRVFRVVGT